jgi:hypothetical protein
MSFHVVLRAKFLLLEIDLSGTMDEANLLFFSSLSDSLSKLPYLKITASYTAIKKYILISDFPRITSSYFRKYVYILPHLFFAFFRPLNILFPVPCLTRYR